MVFINKCLESFLFVCQADLRQSGLGYCYVLSRLFTLTLTNSNMCTLIIQSHDMHTLQHYRYFSREEYNVMKWIGAQ